MNCQQINHATEKGCHYVLPAGFIPQWHLLTEYATQIVRSREPQWPRLEDVVWGCTHCGEHSSTAVTWSAAELHVAERCVPPTRYWTQLPVAQVDNTVPLSQTRDIDSKARP
jgi:hypothetical protein